MIVKPIHVPSRLDLDSALEFSLSLGTAEAADEFVFDFARTQHVEPFPMLLVSSEIRRLMDRFPDARRRCVNFRQMTYAAHMGFFRAFGLDYGKSPGEAKGSARYLPVTIFDCNELIQQAAAKGLHVADAIEAKSKHVAQMLCATDCGPLVETLSYSIREMVRNVLEHSGAARFGICAQYWPTRQKAEVAILDRGIGLKASLQRNPHLDPSDDKRAINYALMPAVSGKAYKGSRQKQRGPWANSGFGLYMTSRICRNGGNFFIASGDTGMLLTAKAQGKRYFGCRFTGTALRLVVRTSKIDDLRSALDRYRDEGYAIQSKYKEIVDIDPSSASLMLSADFDLSLWDKLLFRTKRSHR